MGLQLGGRDFSTERILVVGEVAQAHDGSIGLAHSFIDAIARAGADAVKFQTHLAAAESTPAEPWRVKFSEQDASRYEYWRRMEFTEPQWRSLKRHAHERGLLFLSSPFSVEAVELLTRVGVAGWKIPSGEVSNQRLLDAVRDTRLPMLLSTGMSPVAEIDSAVKRLAARDSQLAVLQCTSAYPCPPEQVGLDLLPVFRERYNCAVGLSDHSGCIYAGLAAAAIGVDVIEVHVTLSREMFGPDVAASLTTEEVRQLVDGLRWIERARIRRTDKDALARELAPMRALFTKSLVARRDLPEGATLRPEDLAAKKPGTGIPAERLDEIVGRRLRRAVRVDDLLQESDLAT